MSTAPPPVQDDRYRLLVDAITDYAIYMLDPAGVITSWNRGAERFKGYSADEIIGHHVSRFYTDEDRAAGVPERALATAASEGRFESEGWRVRKDGQRIWTHVVIDPIWNESGDLIGFGKVTRDLTDRKRAEAELADSERQFRLLVQGVTDYAIFMLDPNGRVSSWNAGAERIKGYTSEEIVGQHFSQFYTEEDRRENRPAIGLETARRHGRIESEGWRVRKDGSRFWASVVIDTIRDERGDIIGFAKITRDVTERKATREALEQAREALFQSQKMEAIGRLTGGVAHDFNNLLMAVLGSLELVQKRLSPDPRITPLINNAIQGAQRGAALTQRMLAFARRQDLKQEPVDVPALVHGMQGLLEHSAGPGIRIETRFTPGTPPACSDANQLEAALLNLVVNARDAMPGGGTILVSGDEQIVETESGGLAAGRYVRLAVSDEGHGMDAEMAAKAIEPFFTTKGIGKGTGLGLSMANGLAEQSGGALRLRSRLGEGTTVEIWLPQATHGRKAATERQTPARATGGRPLVILAVDDDALVLINTIALLEDLGHRALEAASGAEALEILEREPTIDLIITDQAMPDMTGVELAEAAEATRPGLPVILATGYAELPASAEGRWPKLAKPFGQADLARSVADAIGDG